MEFLYMTVPIVVCIILILFFRKRDRKNTQLQTLKNFIQSSITNMQKLFAEKEKEFLDKTINLDISLKKLEKASNFINNKVVEIKDGIAVATELQKKLNHSLSSAKDFQGEIDKLEERIKKYANLSNEIDDLKAESLEMKRLSAQIRNDVEQSKVWAKDNVTELLKRSEAELATFQNNFMNENQGKIEHFVKAFHSKSEELAFNVTRVDNAILESNEKLSHLNLEMDRKIDEEVRSLTTKYADIEKSLTEKAERFNEDITLLETDLKSRVTEISQGIQKTLDESEELFKTDLEKKLITMNEKIENTQSEFETKKQTIIEKVNFIIGDMEKQFDKLQADFKNKIGEMERESARISSEMSSIEEKIKNERDNLFAKTSTELSKEIETVKKTAENNIREKLANINSIIADEIKKFESRFNENLKLLDNKLLSNSNSMNDMNAKFATMLKDNVQKFKDEIIQLKNSVTADTNKYLEELQKRDREMTEFQNSMLEMKKSTMNQIRGLFDELESVKLRMGAFLVDMQDAVDLKASQLNRELEFKVNTSEDKLALLQSKYDQLADSIDTLEKTIEETKGSISTQSREYISEVYVMIENEKKNLDTQLSLIRENVNQFTETIKYENQRSLEQNAKETLSNYQANFEKEIQIFKEKIIPPSDTVIRDIQGRAAQVKNDIDKYYEELSGSIDKINTRVNDVNQNIKFIEDDFMNDFTKKVQTFETNMEDKVKSLSLNFDRYTNKTEDDFKQHIVEQKTQIEDLFLEMNNYKISFKEEIMNDIRELGKKTKEIEIRYDNLLKKTGILDRAESLSEKSEKQIETINTQIKELEQHKREIAGALETLETIKQENRDVNNILNNILINKKDANSILQTIQMALQKAKETEDLLNIIERQENKAEDVKKIMMDTLKVYEDITQKVQEAESKRKIVNELLESIDKSKESINTLNEKVFNIDDKISMVNKLSKSVEEDIKKADLNIKRIFNNQEKVSEAMDKIGDIESLLIHTEEEYKKVNKMREWVGRVENQLEKILESQESIMGDKMKNVPKSGDEETIKNIVRLHDQNWSVEEIAKSLKISRAYVELIIERYAEE